MGQNLSDPVTSFGSIGSLSPSIASSHQDVHWLKSNLSTSGEILQRSGSLFQVSSFPGFWLTEYITNKMSNSSTLLFYFQLYSLNHQTFLNKTWLLFKILSPNSQRDGSEVKKILSPNSRRDGSEGKNAACSARGPENRFLRKDSGLNWR